MGGENSWQLVAFGNLLFAYEACDPTLNQLLEISNASADF